MRLFPQLIPPKKHERDERGLQEKRHDALHGQRRTENVAHKPAVVAPIGAELKFKNNAGRHAHGEVDAKKLHPKPRGGFPKLFARAHIDGFHDAHDQPQSKGKRHENPVVHGRECKLRT